MRFVAIIIPILALSFSFNSKAADYPEPAEFNVINSKDYYRGSHGYNMQSPCTGPSCIPAGSKVGCSDYSYPRHKKIDGATLQVCHISTINNKARDVSMDVSDQDFTMVTGIIRDGKIDYNLPVGERYNATRWRVLHYDQKATRATILPTPIRETEAGTCTPGVDCPYFDICSKGGPLYSMLCAGKNAVSVLAPPTETVEPNFDHKKIADAFKIGNSSTSFASSCRSFIDQTGHLGPRGRKVLDAISKAGKDWFYGGPDCCKTKMRAWDPYSARQVSVIPKPIDVSAVCPKFNTFSQKQKEYFWVWTFAAMANDESTCGMRSDNPRNPNTCGLMQLEKRRKRNRDPVLCNPSANCRTNETFQMECSASILRDFAMRFNFSLTAGGSYWEKLRGNKSVARHIRLYPGCN